MSSFELKFEARDFRVHIHKNVLKTWDSHRQTSASNNESFGVLIGSCSIDEKDYWVELATTPGPNDKRSRSSFLLKDSYHQMIVDNSFEVAKGKSIYCGTWHTHPESYPTPSSIDLADWKKCIARNEGRQLLFIIVGINETRLFRLVGESFEQVSAAKGPGT